jgi:RHS repeat-associated protein
VTDKFGRSCLLVVSLALLGGCRGKDVPAPGPTTDIRQAAVTIADGASPTDGTAILATLRAQQGSPVAASGAATFDTTGGTFKAQFSAKDAAAERKLARVTLPAKANAAVHIEDAGSGVTVDVSLKGAVAADAQAVDGYVVYPAALASGAAVLQRPLPGGVEDFVSFTARPAAAEVAYDVAPGKEVSGLRLVGNTLELLDAGGVPRLRVAPPYVVGADGVQTDATLAVEGCAADSDPSPPWGRRVTAPGAKSCTVRVRWPDAAVVYPAIVDPRWTTTGSMITPRQEHTATLLATGKVLVAGGRSTTGTAALSSAELYDPTTGTWTSTGSMTGARRLHSATQLNTSSNSTTSGKVLVAGGIDGTSTLMTAQLYAPTAGTWIAAGNLNTGRYAHSATRLADGKVLLVGGVNGSTTLASAALYNPASGAGSFAATTGPIPPQGLKANTATLLVTSNQQLNNKVLLVGGNNGTSSISAVYLFDPAQSAFSTLASIPTPREGHTATLMPDGKVLVTGGKNGSTTLATAILFDPGFGPGSWSTTGNMTTARWGHTATLLPPTIVANGQVLVAGGNNGSGTLSSAELYSAGLGTFGTTPTMPGPAQGHTATLLTGNTVLVAGGLNGSSVLNAARLYDGSFGLGCSTNSQCASGFCVGGVCCESACNGGCGACNLPGFAGTCKPLGSTMTCRGSAGACDVAETCSGTAVACPADAFAGPSTACRAAAGECDAAETCSGSSAPCPADALKPSNTACTDDGNVCTQDKCDGASATCQHPAGNAGAVCRASAGQCDAAEACTGTSASCPANGVAPNGTTCDDGNPCTGASSCQAGVCTGTSPVTCMATDQCHDAGTCNPATGACSNPPKANGATCDDGNACTGASSCQAGACAGTSPVTCVAIDQCHAAGTCNPATGACSNPPKANGTTCDDGNACTGASSCQAGACTGTSPVTCVATDQCHDVGTCNPTTGACSNPPKANGATCDDGNACTGASSCQAGACTGTSPVTCLATDQCHDVGTCNPATGACSNPEKANGSPCGGGTACTGSSSCQAGVCAGGSPATVDDGNPCTVDSCDPVTGASHVPVAAGTGCSDGLPCSGPEVCDGHGACVPIADGNSCTTDVCDPGQGLDHVPVAVGTPCAPSASCPGEATCDASGSCSSCVGGQLQVLYRGNQIPNEGLISVPSVLAGSRGVVVSLTLTNVGTGDLVLSGTPNVTITGPDAADFSIQKFPTGTLASGKSAPLQVKFAPSSAGARTASLQLTSNDPSNGSFLVTLTATALASGDLGSDTNGDWVSGATALCNTREARLMARTGDIDNLGFGWPSGFDPFSGFNTPAHGYPWTVNPADPAGTDRIMIGTSFTGGCSDGYCFNTARPANLPQCVAVNLQAECFDGTLPSSAIMQIFVDDFQPQVWGSRFQVTINGKRATQIEDGVNLLAQTGPIGKLMSFTLTPEQLPLLQAGTVTLCVDDPTTGRGDGFALDFVKLLVDVYGTDYKGTIVGQVTALGTGAPIVGATVSAGGVVTTTSDGNGTYVLSNVPAGNVYLYANAPGYETRGQIVDLPNAQTITANISMGPNRPPVITSAPVTQVLVGSTYSYAVAATDPDGDSLTWGIQQPPPGLTFNEFTGQITWSPTEDQVGTWPIVVEVNDRRGGVVVQSFDIHVAATNKPPTVACQQDLHLVGASAAVTIWCAVTDDGQLNGATTPQWYFAFKGSQGPTLTPVGTDRAQVALSAPGIYQFVLTANDGQYQVSDSVIVTLSPTAEPPLTVFAGVDQAAPDMAATLVGTVMGGSLPSVVWSQVDGPAPAQIVTPVAQSTDLVFTNFGTYRFRLTATDGESTDTDDVTVFVQPAGGPPFTPTQGWIGAPIHQSTVAGLAPITVGEGVTLTSGTVTYWPMSAPTDVHTLSTSVSGGPGATLATLDTTGLSNGSYVIQVDATNSTGHSEVSLVAVTVSGEYKPGRVVVEVTDFTLPLAGLPITVGRKYDSLEKDKVGDFGHGWSLAIGHPRLEVDPAHNVTLTLPGGKRTTFQFGGQHYPFPFGYLLAPVFVPEPGVFGTLASDGCETLVHSGNNLLCFPASNLEFAPTTYTYTDPYGRAYVMGATGELRSITDRQGHKLTFAEDGITDTGTGKKVLFGRDGTGRISKVSTPGIGTPPTPIDTTYEYDAAGDLVTVTLPPVASGPVVVHYTYEDHRLATTVDPRGNTARTSTYDPSSGRLATDTDAGGFVTRYAYNLAARTTSITNPDTGVIVNTYDANGLLLSTKDPLGYVTTHEYDDRLEVATTNAVNERTTMTYEHGFQTSNTDSVTRRTYTTYDDFGNTTTYTDALGHVTTIEYDPSGAPALFADELGTRFTFESTGGLPTSVYDAAGKRVRFEYDPTGNQTKKIDRLLRTTSNTYNDLGWKLTSTTARGLVTCYEYDLAGAMTAARATLDPEDPSSLVLIDTHITYDANHNVAVRSVDGISTSYEYNALNQVTIEHHADGTSKHFTFDFRGNKLTETDESARTTTYEYDLAGRLKKTIYPDTTFTKREYDGIGRLTLATDERNNTTHYEYDPGCGCSDRVTKVTDPLGRATRTEYDAAGRRSAVIDAAGHRTDYTYDERGHLRKTEYPATPALPQRTSTRDEYDPRGRRISTTDQTGAVTTYGYDDEGQLTSVMDALTHVTNYGYDDDGNLASSIDANSHPTTYEYDKRGRKTKRTLPLGQFEAFVYDLHNRVSHTDFRGKTTSMTYDEVGRLRNRIPDPSFGEVTESYFYYPTGTRHHTTDASGTTSYTYDQRDRILTKATTAGTLTYTYDATGNVATVRSSNTNGTSVDYAWNAANQLASVTDNRAGGMTVAAYTETGRPSTLSQPNGVSATYTYDNLDRVTSLAWRQGTSLSFANWAYNFNMRGQQTSATDASGRAASYDYDSVARLTSEIITSDPRGGTFNGALTYTLDPVGNRLARASTLGALGAQAFSYDANDQLAGDSYDANGNMTASDGYTYTYDSQNRLVSKAGLGGTATLVYDCDGNRIAKTAGGVTIQYLVDDLNPTGHLQVLEELQTGAVQTRYTYGSAVVSQTYNVSTNPASSYYGCDAHGNVGFLTDAGGAVTDVYEYDAWGTLLRHTGASDNSRLYAGEETDSEVTLINLRHRFYSPTLGRFTALDRIDGQPLLPLSLNRYAYAFGDPVNRIDPTGLLSPAPAPAPGMGGGPAGEYIGLVGAAYLALGTIRIVRVNSDGSESVLQEGQPMSLDDRLNCSFWKVTSSAAFISPTDTAESVLPPGRFKHCVDPCIDQCAVYLGPGRRYFGWDGYVYTNDQGGQWAFQRCYGECKGFISR